MGSVIIPGMDTVTVPGTSFVYKTTQSGLDIVFDVWPPSLSPNAALAASTEPRVSPTFVYFHGGALAAGNRYNFTPRWLFERLTNLGYLFISADYRLLPTSTGHDVVEDIVDLWQFINDPELIFDLAVPRANSSAQEASHTKKFKVKTDSIAVGGTSAGGLCAYLAAVHCTSPKPRALLNMYSMGGEIFTSYYLAPKTEKFDFGAPFLNPEEHRELLYPIDETLFPEASDSILLPDVSNPRINAAWLHLQIGTWLDYYFGEHAPSLSATLRRICGFETPVSPNVGTARVEDEDIRQQAVEAIPEEHRALVPQLHVSKDWPAVFLIHGTADTAVPTLESESMFRLLEKEGVPVEIRKPEGQEHNFDFDFEAEKKWGDYFESAIAFVHRHTVG